MVLDISSDVLARILAEAAASPDAEICGLLFGGAGRIEAAQSCRNVAADPARSFELDPVALLAAHRAARQGAAAIIGHYHSHPSGAAIPSLVDADAATPDGTVWLIAGGGLARAWRAVNDGELHGRFDPVELAVFDV